MVPYAWIRAGLSEMAKQIVNSWDGARLADNALTANRDNTKEQRRLVEKADQLDRFPTHFSRLIESLQMLPDEPVANRMKEEYAELMREHGALKLEIAGTMSKHGVRRG